MPTFKGYLLKSNVSGEFPNKYIKYESWQSNPNQREEIKAYRDENRRDLHRVTAEGRKTALSFEIRDNLHLAEVNEIKLWFANACSNADERKMDLEIWDDDNLAYKTITVYQANPKFKIKKITDDDIIYLGRTVDLVEY